MLFRSIVSIGLAASVASAAPLEAAEAGLLAPFDMPTIQAAFDKISAGIDKMVAEVNAFEGDKSKLPSIIAASDAIEAEVRAGTAAIRKSPAVGFADIITILGPSTAMQAKIESVVSALNGKKEVIDKAGASKDVLEQLTKQKKAADGLSDAILKNLPLASLIGPIAKPIADGITQPLANGIVAWGGEVPPVAPSAPAAPKGKGPAPAPAPKGKGGKGPQVKESFLDMEY